MVMEKFFKTSKEANPNYLATICRIGELHPIEGADKLVKTTVNGFDIVVSKDMNEGDIVVYVPVESALSEKFLSANNLYSYDEWMRNSNSSEVGVLIQKMESTMNKEEHDEIYAEIRTKVGYFNKRGRVRILNLRGCPSNGFIAGVNSLEIYNPKLKNLNWEEYIGISFNYVEDDEFCKKYIPPINEPKHSNGQKNFNKKMKTLKRFDKLVEGQFAYHYDTQRLDATNIRHLLHPTNTVVISVKCHGTSVILSNILINKKLSIFEKIKKFFGFNVITKEYGNIYSSRSVIKNRYINKGQIHDFYDCDIWGCVNRDFSQYLSNGMTVYGEIVGYIENSDKMIQKNHDYGCEIGHWKFMPYRITETDELGNVKEWNVSDVDAWTRTLVKEHPELEEKVLFLDILYHGVISELYPDIPVDEHWYDAFLERIHNDKNFYMELKEPMCHLYEKQSIAAKTALDKALSDGESKKVISKLTKEYEKYESMRAPREGVVIRIDDDAKSEAFKIKTNAHYMREAIQHDADEVDIEEIS